MVSWRGVSLVAAVVLFGLFMSRLGLLLAVPMLVVVASLASDEFTAWETVISAIVLTGLSWLIFVHGLKLEAPLWPGFAAV